MAALLDRRDRRWNNDSWRTDQLASLMEENDLSYADVAEIVDRDVNTIRHWRSGSRLMIPKQTLRLLMLEIALFGDDVLADDDGAI